MIISYLLSIFKLYMHIYFIFFIIHFLFIFSGSIKRKTMGGDNGGRQMIKTK